ncbi:hypothetical protein OVY01_01320 [Robbsia sp. Bb-Pol-6]|uniref:Lipoyl-binding domain-containing protein n=1 Tax=Robbsia betulipollinis TaxID=2981849 RepID=A0ABT3ZH92_9BURK|nr:hypothetical protein [Robbsia betulipollinis]MCY0385901.1 hypothetical protein [Robbsia betulipollinis]
MDVMHLERLIACLGHGDVAEVEWQEADFHLRLSMPARHRTAAPPAHAPDRAQALPAYGAPAAVHSTTPTADTMRVTVRATSPGIFLSDHPDREAFAATRIAPDGGVRLRAGEMIGLLQAGPLYLPVTMPADGALSRCIATPGTVVGYGQALFEISANAPREAQEAQEAQAHRGETS